MKASFTIILLVLGLSTTAQYSREDIYSPVTRKTARAEFKQTLINKTILPVVGQPVNKETENDWESALWAITQFLYTSSSVKKGFDQLFAAYPTLSASTRQSLLEAAYAVYPKAYEKIILKQLPNEKDAKIFATGAIYVYRANPGVTKFLTALLRRNFKDYDNNLLLNETYLYLQNKKTKNTIPSIKALFRYQQTHGYKMVYSFQRKNRDYPGIAIIQNADGSFARNEDGQLKTFIQLARSASNLPWFITNGSTPQGIFSIQGTDQSKNTFIGPTPNLQLVMPNEVNEFTFFHQQPDTSNYFEDYKKLLPPSWKNYTPIYESFNAGKIGRTEIIAHGTTIDPDFFKNKAYYPISPTLGCLCTLELWNEETGKLKKSDMLELTNTFLATDGNKGFLIVIDLDNQQKPVSKEEIIKLVDEYENKNAHK